MQSSRFMFEGKLVNVTEKQSSRYAIGGVQVLFNEGQSDGLALATNGKMLTVTPARRMTAKHDRLAEIVPRDAFPSFASTTVDRFTTEDGVRYATKGALLEPDDGVFPPIADIMEATLPEERIVVGLNAKYLLDLAASLGDKNQTVALVINTARRNPKLGCAEGPIFVTGTVPEHRGVGMLMPIAVSDVQVECTWTKMRSALKIMLEKVAGKKDPRGGSAFAKLARLSGWTPEQRWRRKNQRRLDREEARRVRTAATIPDGQGPAPLQVGERDPGGCIVTVSTWRALPSPPACAGGFFFAPPRTEKKRIRDQFPPTTPLTTCSHLLHYGHGKAGQARPQDTQVE